MSELLILEEELNEREKSINNFKNLFKDYDKEKPTLKEALNQMYNSTDINNEDSDSLTNDIIEKCEHRINKVYNHMITSSYNISKEDAYIICSYTCESRIKDFSPYKILNKNLLSEDKQNGIEKISKYLYILLKAVRQLPKYMPDRDNKYLFRCINKKVDLDNGKKGYHNGMIKTFWGFTSTTINSDTSYDFLKNNGEINKSGTVFILGGDIWGYNITLFNFFGEEEVLLEPERKIKIELVMPPVNNLIHILCKVVDTPLVLPEINENNNENHNEFRRESPSNRASIPNNNNIDYNMNNNINDNINSNMSRFARAGHQIINADKIRNEKKFLLNLQSRHRNISGIEKLKEEMERNRINDYVNLRNKYIFETRHNRKDSIIKRRNPRLKGYSVSKKLIRNNN